MGKAEQKQQQKQQGKLDKPTKKKLPVKEGGVEKTEKKKVKASEIDDIFGKQVKATKASESTKGQAGTDKKAKASTTSEQAAKAPKVVGSKDDIFGIDVGKQRKKTEEGWNVYTEDELGMGKQSGGDTDLCPFDCTCCY